MSECKMCGDTEDPPEIHICTDGAIYQHHSRNKNPELWDETYKKLQEAADRHLNVSGEK